MKIKLKENTEPKEPCGEETFVIATESLSNPSGPYKLN